MPSFKICYFNSRGFAEMSRYMLVEAGVEYEDCRVERDDWPALKPSMPFGRMPVLYVDGKPLAHSRAMLRYLGAELGFDGGTKLSAATNDVWMEVFVEAVLKLPFEEKDEEKRAAMVKEGMEGHVLPVFTKMEEQIKSSGGPYLFGKDPQTADFAISSMLGYLDRLNMDWACHPGVKALLTSFEARPKIAAWIATRPVTEF